MNIPLLDLKGQYLVIKDEIQQAVNDFLDRGNYILGQPVETFENAIAQYLSARHGIGVASGTDALLLSLSAVGVGYGDEVITSPYTFFATAGSISHLGATPVFVDIDPKTYNIDVSLIEEKITSKTKAIIPVHLFGQCCNMDGILEVAKTYNLKVVEDACQAIGAEYKGKKAGTMGDTGCFSFYPTKNLGTFGDGGMIITNDSEIAEKIKMLRVHGAIQRYFHTIVGYNSRLDGLHAVILNIKLKYLDEWNRIRREKANYYNALLSKTDIGLPNVAADNLHIYHQYVIRTMNRDNLRQYLEKRGISTAIYYPIPLHLQECYQFLGYKENFLPSSEQAGRETLALPIYPELTDSQLEEIVDAIKCGIQAVDHRP